MEVVAHDGVGVDLDREAASQEQKALDQPTLAVRVVAAGPLVAAAKPRAAHAAGGEVVGAGALGVDELVSGRGHRWQCRRARVAASIALIEKTRQPLLPCGPGHHPLRALDISSALRPIPSVSEFQRHVSGSGIAVCVPILRYEDITRSVR